MVAPVLARLHTPALSHSSPVHETQIEDHGDEQEDKLDWSHGLMGVQQVRIDDEREWQKDKAEDGDDDPVNRAEEVSE